MMCVKDVFLQRRRKTISVRPMIETGKRVTYQQIRTSLGISMNQVHKILHEHLGVRKLCIRWIPYNLTDAQKLRFGQRTVADGRIESESGTGGRSREHRPG
ncbi:hypothetical protein EVAR_76032_1 [Eumeta japonica]|uniref:Histone-lysine N-methyltransferase SETMAR n=1 Tax=Eumeta variegata TaxID=151549 RepID=A0A4C1UB42_EUMVA|nr:hypothetical protein EVAR_76032_1 [Eumeta japonica]